MAKDISEMTAGEINKRLDRLDAINMKLVERMITAGRGNERPSEYLNGTDELALALRDNFDERCLIRAEMDRRYGPGCPARLPRGL